MKKTSQPFYLSILMIGLLASCSKKDISTTLVSSNLTTSDTAIVAADKLATLAVVVDPYAAIKLSFGNNIDPRNLLNYANQAKPAYILKDNSRNNPITNSKATLGRVLFYDKNLSTNNTISCGSCHKQNLAFSDIAPVSDGVEGGKTVRHSMRLINSRFARETKFFWNERALTLELQTTMPIQDHLEMGFSGLSGRGNMISLLAKLSKINYYKELFRFVYGDTTVTEARMQESLAQFVRSIQSFDSKYDAGRTLVRNENDAFPNFTAVENTGKNLYMTPPVFNAAGLRVTGGAGCNGCHNAPEFDIDPNSRNNGIIGLFGSTTIEVNDTRAPSLRDLTKKDGSINSPMMHNAAFNSLRGVLGHYNNIPLNNRNNNLDARLRIANTGQRLNLTPTETDAIVAFMNTLAGTNVYVDRKWGNPFLIP
ncbi:MAG: cytochrome-c peroxidase [Bacteroidetes bacterium]|nr:cytochrome-c peroxidase [Bacteroidota bacterium]